MTPEPATLGGRPTCKTWQPSSGHNGPSRIGRLEFLAPSRTNHKWHDESGIIIATPLLPQYSVKYGDTADPSPLDQRTLSASVLRILALAAHRGAWAVMDVVNGGFGRRIARAPELEGRYLWQPSRVATERVYFSSIFGDLRGESARVLYSTDTRNPISNFV